MQLMTWMLARLGSRFGLVFEPHQGQIRHSAMGRFLDQPMDLQVGLVEPDGVERVMPFTQSGERFYLTEQLPRLNSVTFRAYSDAYKLRFEFNLHSVFYPQNERLCLMPAFYLEMRVNPADRVRWKKAKGVRPDVVKLFLRLKRPDTTFTAVEGDMQGVELRYLNTLTPQLDDPQMGEGPLPDQGRRIEAVERIVSLTPGAEIEPDGQGLTLELPVTEVGSGTKWRLVWGAFVNDPVLRFAPPNADKGVEPDAEGVGVFRYTRYWKSIDQVMNEAITKRDDFLAHSRLFERLIEQAPLPPAKTHLLHQSFQNFLSNTFWCDRRDVDGKDLGDWFSVWEGSCHFHSTIDVEYNVAQVYLTLWPDLLGKQLDQWAAYDNAHEPSGGAYLNHDMGLGCDVGGQAYDHHMPVEENCNYLLLMQVYVRWTGMLGAAVSHAGLIERLAEYLIWTDRDDSGYPSEGAANTLDDAAPAVQYARKQTYLGVKRVAALMAAADMLEKAGRTQASERCREIALAAAPRIERDSWQTDHYGICADSSAAGVVDAWTGESLPFVEIPGWDAYSIYTTNGLLLPLMCGQPHPFDQPRLIRDLYASLRETLSPYGCGHASIEPENVWVSQNVWRDLIFGYLGQTVPNLGTRYWDLEVMSNSERQSLGFIDTYIGNYLCFYPRGVVSIGYLLAYPRLIIDRLAEGGPKITVCPPRQKPQRWPLLPLVDWNLGKAPVCVVDGEGRVVIENMTDPVTILDAPPREAGSTNGS